MRNCKKYLSKTYSEFYQLSKMKLFATMVKGFQLLIIFAKSSSLDDFQGSECIFKRFSEHLFPNTCIF